MGEPHVQLVNLRKTFGDDVAVDDVSLAIERGSFMCLLGPSGCGKTTTLRMIAGFVDPDAGDVLISGQSQLRLSAHRRPTSIVFQDYALFPHMTVRDNVGYGLRTGKHKGTDVEQRVYTILELMGLERLAHRYPRQLPGGQQQRVALARSVVIEPEVLLMDEPLSNHDAKLRVRLRTDLRALQRQLGITTVYVTHDQEEALAMGDDVAVMNDGRLEQVGAPHELYAHPRTPFVADFIGLNNFIPTVVRKITDTTVVTELSDGQSVEITRAGALAGEDVHESEEASIVVRPEALSFRATPPDESQRVIEGSLIGSQFLGPLRRYWVKVANGEAVVDEFHPSPHPIVDTGDAVWVLLPQTGVTVMKGGAGKTARPNEVDQLTS